MPVLRHSRTVVRDAQGRTASDVLVVVHQRDQVFQLQLRCAVCQQGDFESMHAGVFDGDIAPLHQNSQAGEQIGPGWVGSAVQRSLLEVHGKVVARDGDQCCVSRARLYFRRGFQAVSAGFDAAG